MTPRRVFTRARLWVTERPNLYPFVRSLQTALGIVHSQAFCNSRTDLCVEGYPACANSFLYFVFEECAHQPFRIAHHTHSVANIRRALRYGVPTLVVFRAPEDAIPSYLSRFNKEPMEATLRYIRFYRRVREVADQVSLASFSEVTSHVEKVVQRLKTCSNLQFDIGDPSTLEERVRQRMDDQWSVQESSLFNPRDIPLPNEDRSTAKERARQAVKRLDVYAEAVQEYERIKGLKNQSAQEE